MRLLLLVLLAAIVAALAVVAVRVPRLRASAAQGAILVLVVAGALLVFERGEDGGDVPQPAATRALRDAFVTAGPVGTFAVGVAVRNEGDGLRARATVLDQQGPARDLDVTLAVSGHELRASSCGDGCYETVVPAKRLTSLGVAIDDGERVALRVPKSWPAPRGEAIVRRATDAFRNLKTVTFVSKLGPTTTLWKAHAPNRLSGTELHTGSGAVIIGNRRWDRDSAKTPWVRSPQAPIHQPSPPWPSRFRDARVLGSFVVRDRPVWRVSFLDSLTPAWFTIDVDKETGRTYGMDMVAQAHFMREDYSRFDAPTPIVPPR